MKAKVETQMRYLTIVVPAMDTIPTSFTESLFQLVQHLPENVQFNLLFEKSSLVYDARNNLVNAVMKDIEDEKTPTTLENSYILWLDSDMACHPLSIVKLFEDMDKTEGAEIMSGLYFGRRYPFTPVAYDNIQMVLEKDGRKSPKAVDISDDKINARTIQEVKGVGLGLLLCKNTIWPKLFKAMENSALPFSPILCYGEDLSFCIRCNKAGVKIYCDTGLEAGHLLAYNIASSSAIIPYLRAIFNPPQAPTEEAVDKVHNEAEKKLEDVVEVVEAQNE